MPGISYDAPAGSGSGVTLPIAESDVTNLTTDLAAKAPLASPTFTGTPAAPTAAQGTNTTQVATTAMVHSEAVLLAPLASPTFTGTPAAPTASASTSTTQLATTAMVQAAIAAQVGAVGGFAKIVRRSSDATAINSGTTGTTLTSDDTLLWAVGASDVWFFEGFLLINAANATMDFKAGWSVPASGTMTWGVTSSSQPASIASFSNLATTATANALNGAAGTVTQGTGSATTVGMGIAGFYVGGGTSGNVNLQIAQNTSDAGNLVLKANSFLRLNRLA